MKTYEVYMENITIDDEVMYIFNTYRIYIWCGAEKF